MRTILLSDHARSPGTLRDRPNLSAGKHDPGTIARHDLLPQWLGAAGLCA